MPAAAPSHPDRLAATLAQLDEAHHRRTAADGPFAPPGDGSADCRIDLKLWQWRALEAVQRSEAAQKHLEPFPRERHPDLWAGTVQDGVARGFAVRLEEAVALADGGTRPAAPDSLAEAPAAAVTGKELRRRKDLLVASATTRARFTRKGGLLLVDRELDVHSENCLWFEARRDLGTLDGFVGAPDERPRLFSAQFLKPERYVDADGRQELVLAGRLGRGPVGWPCRLTLHAHREQPGLRLSLHLLSVVAGWRLRSRFLGVPASLVDHHCTPVRELVHSDRGGFVADTLVRANATLLVDGAAVATPDAAGPAAIRHEFSLGVRS